MSEYGNTNQENQFQEWFLRMIRNQILDKKFGREFMQEYAGHVFDKAEGGHGMELIKEVDQFGAGLKEAETLAELELIAKAEGIELNIEEAKNNANTILKMIQ